MGTECMRTKRQKRGLLEQNLQAWPQGPAPLTPIPTPQCPNPKEMPPDCSCRDKRGSADQGPRGVSEEGAQAWAPSPEMRRMKRWGKHRKREKGSSRMHPGSLCWMHSH